jgi:hypothetical protein
MICDYCGNCIGVGGTTKDPVSFYCKAESPKRLLGRRPTWTGRAPDWCPVRRGKNA